MIKKIMALMLTVVMCSGTFTAFAKSENLYSLDSIEDNGITKYIQYFGDIKIVSWENDEEIVVEQYDSDGILVETSIGNKETNEIINHTADSQYITNSEDVIECISSEDLPILYSFNEIATINAINPLNGTRKTMDLYEEVGSAKNTTYKVSKYNGALANYIASVAIGIGISTPIAGNVVTSLVTAGIGFIVGEIINITSTITLSCKKYAYNYYGKDSISGEKSATYDEAGFKYVINDDEHVAFYNQVYYDGFVYDKINSTVDYNLSVMIVRNLYGIDYDVY